MKSPPRHFWVAASAWGSRGVTAIVSLASVRLLLERLGDTRYAAFVLLSNLLTWVLLSDLGIRNAAQNYISERRALRQDFADIVSSAVSSILAVGLVLLGASILLSGPIGDSYLSEIGLSDAEKGRYIVLCFFLFALTSIGNMAYNTWYAVGEGYFANIAAALSALLGLLGIYLVGYFELQDPLAGYLVATAGVPAAISLLALARIVDRYKVSFHHFSKAALSAISHRAPGFLSLALLSAILLNVDYLIMGRYLSAQDVVVYTLGSRVFDLARLFYTAWLQAVRPQWTEDYARGSYRKLMASFKKNAQVSASWMAVLSLGVYLLSEPIMKLLAPEQYSFVDAKLILCFGAFEIVRTWCNTYFMGLVSMSKLKALTSLLAIQVGISLLFQLTLLNKIGVYALPMGAMLGYLALSVWYAPRLVRSKVSGSSSLPSR